MPKIIENIRENILENGKLMLLEGNFNDFNIRNLAKKCGLGLGTFYNYFSNKEELAYHIFKYDWDKTLYMADELKDSEIPLKEKLRSIYSSMETFIGQYMSIFKEIAGDAVKTCPNNYYKDIAIKLEEIIIKEKNKGNIKSDILPAKLSNFILVNMFNYIRTRIMSFDELYDCMRI